MVLPRRDQVTKTYDARLATRITTSVDSRLRQLALLQRRRISHLLNDLLDAVLPTGQDLAAQFARCTSTSSPAAPDASTQPAGTGPGGTTPTPAPSTPPR